MSADVRAGGVWTTRQTAKNAVIYAAATLALGACRRLPYGVLRGAGRALGHVVASGWRRGRTLAAARLAATFGASAPTPRLVLVALGEVLADTIDLWRGGPVDGRGLTVDEASLAVLTDALAENRGVVFATAHLGPWERMAALLSARGLPIATVAREPYDPRFSALYDDLRARRGVRALYRGRPGFPKALVRALRDGMVVGFPMDLGGRVRVTSARWLDGDRPTPLGPAEIALRRACPVVVGTPAPGPAGLVIRIERIVVDADTTAASLTSTLAERLSERIRALPLPYPWMHGA